MRFSEAWLREWVQPAASGRALGELLTMAGLEMDGVELAAPEFTGVVVGDVLEAVQHPNADRLRVCTVSNGTDDPVEVVCGAPNVRKGLRVAFSQVGAVLPGNFKIRKSKLRGVVSHGMICSSRELGLGDEHDGIIELPADAPVGMDVREYLKLDDHVIEIDLTPNRGDCLSIAGLAREVAAISAVDSTPHEVPQVPAQIEDTFPVELQTDGCPVYAGRIIRGIDPTARTPAWLAERLRRGGVRPISPVVDVTNYVMLELGQPMHGFDLRQLRGGIVVRDAAAGETLTLLDGKQIELSPEVMVICDHERVVALAGIMGGEASGVAEDTQNVFFESAYFTPLAVAGRARSFGLHTDASHRYERGVDPTLQVRAIERATALLTDIAGGKPGPVLAGHREGVQHVPRVASLRRARLAHVLGVHIDDEQVGHILSRLGLEVTATETGWDVSIPGFRFDLAIEEDLIEEVARVYGYDRIPEAVEVAAIPARPVTETQVSTMRMRVVLADRGYQEAITYSFVEPSLQALFVQGEGAMLANPISSDMAVMRLSLLPGLSLALKENLSRQQSRVRLFEVGMRYVPQSDKSAGGYEEERLISGLIAGQAWPEQWAEKPRPIDFFDLKADVQALLDLGEHGTVRFEAAQAHGMHPGQCAKVLIDGQKAGVIGALHPALVSELDVTGPVYAFELRTQLLATAPIATFEPVSKHPHIRRDLAVIVDTAVTVAELQDVIDDAAPELVKSVTIFDVYTGQGIDSGRKSIALGLILQDSSRNLTGGEADQAISAIRSGLESNLQATIRD